MFIFVIIVNNTNGDVMRKSFLFLFLLIILLCYKLFIPSKQDIQPVFSEQDNTYNLYLLDISKEDINTNNLANYFDNIKILEIYPYVNPLYKKIMHITKYNFNTTLSNKKNISNFINQYLDILADNALKEELVKYGLNGIKINSIKVYASNVQIKNIINSYNLKIIKKY